MLDKANQSMELGNLKDERKDSFRMCDNCVLNDRCPFATENGTCYFDKVKEIASSNKSDIAKSMAAILEIQLDRILHMYHLEKLNGGYANQDLSMEMDRFFSNLTKMKSILSSDTFLKVEASGNILKELFNIK